MTRVSIGGRRSQRFRVNAAQIVLCFGPNMTCLAKVEVAWSPDRLNMTAQPRDEC